MNPDDLNGLYAMGGAIAIMVAGGFGGLRWVLKQASAMTQLQPVETRKTTIVTGDTIAMDRLTGALDSSNVILTENNVLRREELHDRKMLREALEENTKAVEHATAQTIEARREIRDLERQIASKRL